MTTKLLHQHETLGYLSILNDHVASRAIDERSPLIVRKLSFTCPVPVSYRERLSARLKALTLKDTKFTLVKSTDSNYRNCTSYQTANGTLLHILWGPRNPSINFVKCEVDTSDLSDQCSLELNKIFRKSFSTKFVDRFMRRKSRINKVIVEIKLKNIEIENIVLSLKRCKSYCHVVGNLKCHSYKVIGSKKCNHVIITRHIEKNRKHPKEYGFDTDITFVLQPKKENISFENIKNIKIKFNSFFILTNNIKECLPICYLYMLSSIGLRSTLEQISNDESDNLLDAINKYKYPVDNYKINEWLIDTFKELNSIFTNHNQ